MSLDRVGGSFGAQTLQELYSSFPSCATLRLGYSQILVLQESYTLVTFGFDSDLRHD